MQKYIFILIAIVCLCLIVQPAIAYNPQQLDTLDIYNPYYIQLIDSSASPYDTFWVKAGEIKTAYGIFDDSIHINNAHIIMNSDSNYIYIGEDAGSITGRWNVYIGESTGVSNTTGRSNVYIGRKVGVAITTGRKNVYIGEGAGYQAGIDPSENTCVGFGAGGWGAGDNNVFLGYYAGMEGDGSYNVFIGSEAGYSETDSNRLHISVSRYDSLIYGEFDSHYVFIKDSLYVPALVFDRVYSDTFNAYWDTLGQIDSCIYADSAVWAGLLDGYNEDYFLDTNDTRIDSATYADTALYYAISDSIFFQQGVIWGSEVWLKDGDTIFVDTTSGGAGDLTGHDSTNFLYSDTVDIGEFISVLGTKVFEVNLDSDYVYIGEGAGSGAGISNIFIGTDAGKSNTTGEHNTAIGYRALESNTTGDYSFALGSDALRYNSSGTYNVAIGKQAMYEGRTTIDCVALGRSALYYDSTGSSNMAIGANAGKYVTIGSNNAFVGHRAGEGVGSDGNYSYNVAIGSLAGLVLDGVYSTFIGYEAGYKNTGNNNTAIGRAALHENVSGVGNLCLGYGAGYYETSSNNLHIANSHVDTLIYGEFDNHYVFIKDSVYIPQLVTDDIYLGGGETVVKFTKIGSHLAIVLNASADTFWIATDTTGF